MLTKLNSLREKNEDGFTLIELLIVVVIIGILASIAIPIFLNQQKAALNASVKSDVRNTVTGVATYLTQNPQATLAQINTNTKKVISDTQNTVVITGTNGWSDYVVTGQNNNTNGTFVFRSTTGAYTDTLS